MTKIEPPISILLNAVLAVVADDEPKSLCVKSAAGLGLPYGPFDPQRHRTFELGLRNWVSEQTKVALGYVEQLYTFGDAGRESPTAVVAGGDRGARVVSVGYLALAAEPAKVAGKNAEWRSWYEFFPWEDWRAGEPRVLAEHILPKIFDWAQSAKGAGQTRRRARIALAFGLGDSGWEEERALERYELMYEAGLVEEAVRDRAQGSRRAQIAMATGRAMTSDHRRILATAIGRLRGKLKYRPVIFELMPPEFTLFALQRTVESIVGFEFHKQNFRRSVEQSGLIKRTEATMRLATGRPAALFRPSPSVRTVAAAQGLAIPRLRRAPAEGRAVTHVTAQG